MDGIGEVSYGGSHKCSPIQGLPREIDVDIEVNDRIATDAISIGYYYCARSTLDGFSDSCIEGSSYNESVSSRINKRSSLSYNRLNREDGEGADYTCP